MQTIAVPCDGNSECDMDADETWICEDHSLAFYSVLVSCILVMMIHVILKLSREKDRSVEGNNTSHQEIIDFEKTLETEGFAQHDSNKFKRCLNFYMLGSIIVDTDKERVEKSKRIYESEFDHHKKSVQQTLCCLKNTFEPLMLKALLDDLSPGFIRYLDNFLSYK